MSTYESLRAQIEAHEAEEARLLAEIDALRARAEAAEQRAEALAAELAQARAEGEAAGYRRAIDDACAALDRRHDVLTHRLVEDDHYGAGRLRGLDLAERYWLALALCGLVAVCALAGCLRATNDVSRAVARWEVRR